MQKILIIEDDNTLNDTISDFLKIEGYNTYTAHNGLSGIQIAIDVLPDIILCDVEMPKLNGLKVYEIIKNNEQLKNTPFIFISVRSSNQEIRHGMLQGADDYICKPFDYNELLSSIKVRLKKNEYFLKESVSNTLAIIENSDNSILLLDENKVLLYNKKFLKFLGYNNFDLKNLDFFELIEFNKRNEIKTTINKCITNYYNTFKCTFHIKTKDGKFVNVELKGSSIFFNKKKVICAELTPFKDYKVLNKSIHFENTDNLSKREIEILKNVCKGLTNQEISTELNISPLTVDKHRSNILSKTNSKNTAQLVVYAFENKLLTI